MANEEFWLGRWKRGEIGWHQSEVEQGLVKWARTRAPGRIMVPLCGKSLDMIWLAANGYEVVGIELSQIACEAFFSEHKINYQKSSQGDFTVMSGSGITVFNGDFFNLTPELLGSIDLVYDRAALIALPPELRAKYSEHLLGLTKSATEVLQIVIARTPHDVTGPPYSVQMSEVGVLYGEKYKIEVLSKEAVSARAPEGSFTEEFVLKMTLT